MNNALIVSSAVALACVAAPSRAAVLFDGSTSPTAQGWTVVTNNGGGTTASDGNVFTIDTLGTAPTTGTSAALRYTIAAPQLVPAGYDVETRLRVTSAASNFLDGGAVLMVGGNPNSSGGDSTSRSLMVMFTPTTVYWGDLTQSAALDATQFHTYRLNVTESGVATLYIDEVAKLQRTGYTSAGYVSFGDQTNDPNVNGRMEVDYVSATAIPEPAAIGAAALAALPLALRRRRA